MNGRMKPTRRRVLVLALAGVAVVALGGTALAGHMDSAVKSYTGCLVPRDGVIIKVKEGDVPASPCTAGMTQVHLSGGDITKISVTGALTGGGDNGEVTIGLKPEFTLPSGCESGQVAKWNGTAWECKADNDTTYSNGTGLDLSPSPENAFSIKSAYRIPGKTCSTSGEFARGFDSNGTIQCAAPPAGGPATWITRVAAGNAPSPNPPGALIAELALPAGSYLATAAMVAESDSHDDDLTVECNLRLNGETSPLLVRGDAQGDISVQSITLVDAFTFSESGKLQLRCWSHDGNNHVEFVRLVATQASSITVQ